MSPQLKIAFVRGLISAVVNAGTVFFTGLAVGAGTTGKISAGVLTVAGISAGGVFFSTLALRFAAEGLIDQSAAAPPPPLPKVNA